jgi:hypothetical protein
MMSYPFRGIMLVAVILLGCGGKAEEPKNSSARPSESQGAVVQKTGTPANTLSDSATGAGAQSVAAKPTVFAARDLAKVLNVNELPVIKGSTFQTKSAACLVATVPAKVGDAADFYRKELISRGWELVPPPDARATEEYVDYHFQKDGHIVNLRVGKCSEIDKKPQSMVEIYFHGNFDTRSLPTPEGKEDLHASQASSTYLTTRNVAETVQWVRRTLTAAGWQEYSRRESSEKSGGHNDDSFLTFRKQGYALTVYLGIHPIGKKTYLQYSVAALAHELPAPPEATKVHFNDNRWEMKCEVPGQDMKTVAAFYQKSMPAAGYKPLPGEEPRADYWNLRFGTEQGDVIMVQVQSKKGEPTKVFVDGIPAAVMAKIKEGEGKPASAR